MRAGECCPAEQFQPWYEKDGRAGSPAPVQWTFGDCYEVVPHIAARLCNVWRHTNCCVGGAAGARACQRINTLLRGGGGAYTQAERACQRTNMRRLKMHPA
eukprot:363514-Chlamydomonas_euryale.AAC.12